MLEKISIGCGLGAATSIAIVLVLDGLFAPDPPDVPYGSMMPMPIFYLGILGAIIGAMIDLVSRNRKAQAAVTGIIGGGIVGMIMSSFWLAGHYPLFHYSNVIIYIPVVIASGFLVLLSIALAIRVIISKGRNAQ